LRAKAGFSGEREGRERGWRLLLTDPYWISTIFFRLKELTSTQSKFTVIRIAEKCLWEQRRAIDVGVSIRPKITFQNMRTKNLLKKLPPQFFSILAKNTPIFRPATLPCFINL
jgi:hypothetical protein